MSSASQAALADPNIAAFAAQAELARGRTAEACRRAQDVSAVPAPSFVLRLRAFCFAAADNSVAADLAMEVARGAGVDDPFFYAALPVVYGMAKGGPGAKFDTSLNAAISLAGGLKIGPKPLDGASMLALDVVAVTAEAPPALRAQAADTGLRGFALPAPAVRAAFEAAKNVQSTKTTSVPRLVGALKAVETAPSAPARALAIETALKGAQGYGDFVATARLLEQDINALPRDATTAIAAPMMARANLALGDGRQAAVWRNLITKSPQPPPEAIRSAYDAALVASGQGGAETARVVLERRIVLSAGLSLRRAARDTMILGALGVPGPPSAANFVALNPPLSLKKADPALLAQMVQASERKAQGETALLAAMAIAPGADQIEAAAVVSVIQALRAAGLEQQARIVAVEAMIGDGVQ